MHKSTIPANVTINQDIRKDCSAVNADPTRLNQIAMNFITNVSHALEKFKMDPYAFDLVLTAFQLQQIGGSSDKEHM